MFHHRLLAFGAALVLCAAMEVRAEEPATELCDDPWALDAPRYGVRALLLYRDGTVAEVKVVAAGPTRILIRVDPKERVRHTPPATIATVPRELLRGFVSLETDYAHSKAGEFRVLLDDGTVRGGPLLEERDDAVVLGGPDGPRELPRERIRRLWRVGFRAWGAYDVVAPVLRGTEGDSMSAAARYLEVPSDLETAPGAVRLRVLRGAHVLAGWAPRPDVSVEVGSALPVLHAVDVSRNVQGAVRGSVALLPGLRVGGGFHLETSTAGRTAGAFSVSTTVGGPGATLTLYAGPTFAGGAALSRLGELAVAGAGSLSLSHRFDLVAEAWASRRGPSREVLGIGALRTRMRWLTLDLGLARSRLEGGLGAWIGLAVEVRP